MPDLGRLPYVATLLAISTQTTTGTSANITLPAAAAYRFFVKTKTVSGTSPTLDIFLSTSYDATGAAGTDYETFAHFAQITSSGLGRQMTFRPYLSSGDIGVESQSAFFGTGGADGATGATAIVTNGPINIAAVKIRYVIGGTTPSFAFEVGVIASTSDLND